MKSLFLLGAVAVTGGGLWLRDHNQKEAIASRERATLLLADMQRSQVAGDERRWTKTQTGWVNHQAGVSPMQSQGLGGGYAGMPREKKKEAASDKVQSQWGWQNGGTSLDRK